MAIKAKDIYQGRKKTSSPGRTVVIIILAVLIAAVVLFYGLRHYAVYDENGNATIVLPFSHGSETEEPSTGATESAEPNTSDSGETPSAEG